MKILFLSCYSSEYFDKLLENNIPISIAIQKFSRLYLEGFKENGAQVDVIIPSYPKAFSGRLYEKARMVKENGIQYYYMPKLSIKKLGGFVSLFSTKAFVKRWCRSNPDGVVVIDYMRERALAVSNICRRHKMKNVCVITDRFEIYKNDSLLKKIKQGIKVIKSKKTANNATHLVLLTKYMNPEYNRNNKTYIISEGLTDSKLNHLTIQKKTDEKIIMYAGGVSKKNGVAHLTEGFIKADIPDAQLHIYGSGDYASELDKISKLHSNIKFLGVVPNEIVVAKQKEAFLLVNPRPSDQEFTKYSFPSKNMEYMASGTAALFTKLPCIPEEYYDKSFYIDDESVEGFADKIKSIFDMKEEDVYTLGKKAREFIMNEKNNIVQAQKILDMVNK